MISCFIHGKSKLDKKCEDTLTSGVFDLLRYLPDDMFWEILKGSLYNNNILPEKATIMEFSFWDKWDHKGTSNTKFVEPDVFIRCQEFDVIIEAKRYDANQQSENQAKKEVKAYHNEYANENKLLYFIQVGGLNDLRDADDISYQGLLVKVCKTDWSKILNKIVAKKEQLEILEQYNNTHIIRILTDIIRTISLHGFAKILWAQDVKVERPIINYNLKQYFNYGKQ